MAFSIRYARLFEVKILHGYHLDRGEESNFYELDVDIEEDATFKRVALEGYDLSEAGISVQPTNDCDLLLRNHKMVFRPTANGFFVGIKVREEKVNNTTVLFPKIPIEEGTIFRFKIKSTRTDWYNTAGLNINPNVKANYYFSNFEDTELILPPSLSKRPLERSLRYYEMGELVYNASNGKVYEAVKGADTSIPLTNLEYWRVITDHRFVNGSCHVLLPLRFTYRFTSGSDQNITGAVITLSDLSGQTVANIEFEGKLHEVTLDFARKGVNPGKYILKVQSDEYLDTRPVMLQPSLFETGSNSIVAIGHKPGLPVGLKLLEPNGALHMLDGKVIPPKFEIRYPARKTYWRYILHPKQENFNTPGIDADVISDTNADDQLITVNPKPITKHGVMIKYDEDILLPNPTNLQVYSSWVGASKLHFSNIYLNRM